MLADDDLVDRPPEQRLAGIGHEREHAVGISAPDDVRGGLHEASKRASSRVTRARRFEFVSAMAAWSASPCKRSRSAAPNVRGDDVDTASVPMTSPPGARWRRRHRRPAPSERRRIVVGFVGDARVGHVVGGPDGRGVSAARPLIPPPSGKRIPNSHVRSPRRPHQRRRPGSGSHRPAPSAWVGAVGVEQASGSSTTRSSSSSGSVSAAMRAVMSRSSRSVSARRARARCERSSSSMRRALVIAMAACSASRRARRCRCRRRRSARGSSPRSRRAVRPPR